MKITIFTLAILFSITTIFFTNIAGSVDPKIIHLANHTEQEARLTTHKEEPTEELNELVERFSGCQGAMQQALANDSRFIPQTSPATDTNETLAQFNTLAGDNKLCAINIIRQHQTAFYETCEQLHCGDNINGGCAQLTNYSINQAVLALAYQSCH